LAIISVTIGGSIVPGQTALIRIPRGAAGEADHPVFGGVISRAAWQSDQFATKEEQLTMAPLPWVRIGRSSCFM
jgi:hypothetical protein